MNTLMPISGRVQAYQWGGFDYLPQLLQYTNTEQQPQAEYWLGVHPAAPAQVQTPTGDKAMADVLEDHNCKLDFLFKILDVREMLSIQVHPTREQAAQGFYRENEQGIAANAKNRNYKDINHKPELMVALSEFWLLHGFKTEAEIATSLASKNYLAPMLERLNQNGLRAAFELALDSDNPVIKEVNRNLQLDFNGKDAVVDKNHIEFWIQRWLDTNPQSVKGLLTLYFLNLVKLAPGDALYQPAGLLHAYLEGQNVELMANSDNVLRAGLTPKHIDVAELLKIGNITSTAPKDYLIQPQRLPNGERRFPTPFEEFELSELHSARSERVCWRSSTVEILMCLRGEAKVSNGTQQQRLRHGQTLLILPDADIKVEFCAPQSQLYKAKNL